ncbi:hypothetical protein KIPB_002469 [Kipferlia bialata]|uniref:Uncharacterized protein n=1 Tax=Kipferlia bialata TaxID=797122 RepID=A0A9K3CQN9_9EUKA|nr:hypothetical protein KIPB_002469 [Kipferlia bialata]|eukprot:g2469.t1
MTTAYPQYLSTDGSGQALWAPLPEPSLSATAAADLSVGDPVIVNSLGTFSPVVTSPAGLGPSSHLKRVVAKEHTSMAEDIHGNIVVVYGHATPDVASVRLVAAVGPTIAFGPEVSVSFDREIYYPVIVYNEAADCFFIVFTKYISTGSIGYAVTVTVLPSGSLSLGVATAIGTVSSDMWTPPIHCVYHRSSGTVLIAYRNSSNYGFALAATVTDPNTITFHTEFPYTVGCSKASYLAHDPVSNDTLLLYCGFARALSVAGTTISSGSDVYFASAHYAVAAFDPVTHQALIAYYFGNTRMAVADIAGNVVSVTGAMVVTSQGTAALAIEYDYSRSSMMFATHYNSAHDRASIWEVSVAGSTISVGYPPLEFTSGAQESLDMHYSTATHSLFLAYTDPTGDEYRAMRLYTTEQRHTLGAGAYGGIVSEAAAAHDVAVVVSATGVASGLQDLTPGSTYYLRLDGSLSQLPASPVVSTGVAMSATTLQVAPPLASDGSRFTTRGSVSAGDPLVLNHDGTVSSVREFPAGYGGTMTIGSSFRDSRVSLAANDHGVLAVYQDTSKDGYARFITVDGDSVAYGLDVQFPSGHHAKAPQVVYDVAHDVFVVVYNDENNSDHTTALVVSVSRSGSISLGSSVVVSATAGIDVNITYDAQAQKVVVAYVTIGQDGYVVLGTVAGTSISFELALQFSSSTPGLLSLIYHPFQNLTIIGYQGVGGSGDFRLLSVVGSGLFLSLVGTLNGNQTLHGDIATDPVTGDMLFVYTQYLLVNSIEARVGTLSAGSLTLGPSYTICTGLVGIPSVVHDPQTSGMLVVYPDTHAKGHVGTSVPVTLSGSTVSVGTPTAFNAIESSVAPTVVYNPASQCMVLAYSDLNSGYQGYTLPYHTTIWSNLSRGCVGIGTESAVDSGVVSVSLAGSTAGGLSGLVPGAEYYILPNGSVSLSGSTPGSEYLGRAISATDLHIASPTVPSDTHTTEMTVPPSLRSSSPTELSMYLGHTGVAKYSTSTTGNMLSMAVDDEYALGLSTVETGSIAANSVSSLFLPGYTEITTGLDSGWDNTSGFHDLGVTLRGSDGISSPAAVYMSVTITGFYSGTYTVSDTVVYHVTSVSTDWKIAGGSLFYGGDYLTSSVVTGSTADTSYPLIFKLCFWDVSTPSDSTTTLRAIRTP